LQVVSQAEPQCFFSGGPRKIEVTVHNPDAETLEANLRTRLFQLTSATAVPISDTSWKRLQVLSKQTVSESAVLTLPPVTAASRFLVLWGDGTSNVIGRTELMVYPPDLLAELKPLLGEDDGALGVFDPQNQLKPLLKSVKADFTNLEDAGLDDFHGKLAIIGPFTSQAAMREGLVNQIATLAKNGVAVVWLQPPAEKHPKLLPSFYCVPLNGSTTVIVQPELVANLSGNPQSQLNLIHFCKLARHSEPPSLPQP